MIKFYDQLEKTEKEAIKELYWKPSLRTEVLDQWKNDQLETVLVKFITWKEGTIRCIISSLGHEQAAAFYFPDSVRARQIVLTILEHFNDS